MPFKTLAILVGSVIIAAAVTVWIASNLGAPVSVGVLGLFAICAVLVLRINRTDDN